MFDIYDKMNIVEVLNMKKIFLLLTIFISFILFIPNTYALDISIKDIEILDKSDDVKISNVSRDNLMITPNITFSNPNEYVVFKVTFKGNDINNNRLLSVSDNNESEYIETKYKYDDYLSSESDNENENKKIKKKKIVILMIIIKTIFKSINQDWFIVINLIRS